MGRRDTVTEWQDDKVRRLALSSPHFVSLSLIVIVYLAIGARYAALTPRWQVPDEPAHYNYVRFIVDTRSLPILDPGEYQQGYLAELTSKKFPPELPIDSLQYESWQPPLYYLLAAPLFAASSGDLLTLRLFSLLLGAGVIIFAYLAAREAVPNQPLVAVTAAGFIAFIPQHIAMMAGVNNDSLSELLIAAGLWLILLISRSGVRSGTPGVVPGMESKDAALAAGSMPVNRAAENTSLPSGHSLSIEYWVLGIVIGLAFITKSHAYLLAPVAGISLFLKLRAGGWGEWRAAARRAAIVFIPALIIGGWWWGRNLSVYGWPDFMAAIRHDQVVADQPRTEDWIAQLGATEVVRRFFVTTFHSFWGQFGWMGVPMPEKYYAALGAYTAILVIGYWLFVLRPFRDKAPLINNLLLTASALLTLALYLYYNLTYVQHQGRYLFPALVPIGLAASLSLWGWGESMAVMLSRPSAPLRTGAAPKHLASGGRSDIAWLVPFGALAGMASLSLFALDRFIIPALR